MLPRLVISVGCCVAHMCVAAQIDSLRGAFLADVATMQSMVNGVASSEPVIMLGGDEVLRFEFDILRPERDYLRYELIHCDADWQPSALSPSEYADGFNEWTIDDYVYSQSTAVPYTHYYITLSGQAEKPRVSGNYLLRIYVEDKPDNTIAQYRFIVTEQTAHIDAKVTTNTDVDFNKEHQQLSIIVDTEQSGVRDPFNDLIVRISQNDRLDNAAEARHPLKMLGHATVSYEHMPQFIFEAGNEYRRFETVSEYNPTMGVAGVEFHDPYYHYTLYADEPRADGMYLYDQTLRGGFVVRSELANDSSQEADYGIVHFTLDFPESEAFDIYIDSDFVSRRLDSSTRMAYNRHTGMYELSFLLKQGAYSYQYLCVPKGETTGSPACIEGNYYQTNNRYRVVVYARNPLDRYDRIIAVAELESMAR